MIPVPARLNIGCGRYPHPDYLNLDINPEVQDFVRGLGFPFRLCLAHRLPFDDASADAIYASHLLEHFGSPIAEGGWMPTVHQLLDEWHRVLRPGGDLYVAVPDLETIAARILTEPKRREDWIAVLFGCSKREGDLHCWAYTRDSLGDLLRRHGFEPVGPFAPMIPDPGPKHDGFDCAGAHQHDDEGRDVPCSLNVHAKKKP